MCFGNVANLNNLIEFCEYIDLYYSVTNIIWLTCNIDTEHQSTSMSLGKLKQFVVVVFVFIKTAITFYT